MVGRTTLQVSGQVLFQGALPQPAEKGQGWRADIWTRRAAHSAQTWPHSAPRVHAPVAHIASRCSTASSAGGTSEDHFLPKENRKAGPGVPQATWACSVCRSPRGYRGLLCQAQSQPVEFLNAAPGGCHPVPRSGFRCDPTFQPGAQGEGRLHYF